MTAFSKDEVVPRPGPIENCQRRLISEIPSNQKIDFMFCLIDEAFSVMHIGQYENAGSIVHRAISHYFFRETLKVELNHE